MINTPDIELIAQVTCTSTSEVRYLYAEFPFDLFRQLKKINAVNIGFDTFQKLLNTEQPVHADDYSKTYAFTVTKFPNPIKQSQTDTLPELPFGIHNKP